MKKVISFILAVTMLFSLGISTAISSSAAAEPELYYSEDYNAKKNTVTVTVGMKNAVGLDFALIFLVYDEEIFSIESGSKPFTVLLKTGMIEGGKTEDAGSHQCSCAFMTFDSLSEKDCKDDGSVDLAKYEFKVIGNYKEGTFYLYPETIEINENEVNVKSVGNQDIAPAQDTTANREAKSGMEPITGSASSITGAKDTEKNSKNIIIYVLTGVIVVAAAAVIFVIVTKKKNAKPEQESKDDKIEKESDK